MNTIDTPGIRALGFAPTLQQPLRRMLYEAHNTTRGLFKAGRDRIGNMLKRPEEASKTDPKQVDQIKLPGLVFHSAMR